MCWQSSGCSVIDRDLKLKVVFLFLMMAPQQEQHNLLGVAQNSLTTKVQQSKSDSSNDSRGSL